MLVFAVFLRSEICLRDTLWGIGKNCPGTIISSVQEPLGGLVVNGRKYLDCGPLYFHISKPANKVMLWNSGWEK